jgi:hypothetical protein
MNAMGQAHLIFSCLMLLFVGTLHAEMINGPIKFFPTTSMSPNTFGIRAYYQKNPDDPYMHFTQSYGPSKSFLGLVKSERVLKPIDRTLSFDARLYVVNKGDVVTSAGVEAGQFKILNGETSNKLTSATVRRDFWLMVAVKKFATAGTPPARPFLSFSWAHMKFNALGRLEMLDSITAYDEPGLVIGEKTPCHAQACLDAPAP